VTVIRTGGLLDVVGADIPRDLGSSPSRTWAGLKADYGAIWRTQPQVRKVVGFLARNIAQLNLTLYKRVSDTDRERDDHHELARAIRHPLGWKPGRKLSKTLFLETLVSDRCIYDDAFWRIVRLRTETYLVPIPPMMIEPLGDEWLSPEAYLFQGPDRTIELAADEIVHFRGYNAGDRRTGLSPIESLRQILIEDLLSDQYREQLWERGARISGVIERPKDAPDWSPQARKRFRDEFGALWAGTGPEAGGAPVLEEGMTWKNANFSPRDTLWLEAKKLTREEVAAAYHVPQPVVGILDRATFSNVRELHRSVYQDTLPPWCVGIEEDIEQQLIPDWQDLVSANAYMEFNLLEKLKGSFEEQARSMQTATGAPWLTRNEARAIQNRPRIDDPACDQLIVPLNVLVGGQASPTDSAPPLDVAQAVARFLERCARATLGRWHEVRAGVREIGTVWQPERWGVELLADLEDAGLTDGAEELCAKILERTRDGVLSALTAEDPEQTLAQFFGDAEPAAQLLVSELTEEPVPA
jgi:HK97 family phage portal protein